MTGSASPVQCLSLDLGRNSGWAAGDLRDRWPLFGSFRIAGREWGEQGVSLAGEVGKLIERFKPAVLAYEQPIVIHMKAAQLLAGYAFLVEYLGASAGAAVTPIDNNYAKQVFAGRKYSKKHAPYPGIVRAEELGFAVETHDQADALAIWFTARHWLETGRICVA